MRTSILLILVFTVFALASAPAYSQRAEASIEIAADEAPDAYRLTAPHPNPFNPQTQKTRQRGVRGTIFVHNEF